ncbi:scoloptoxin SSD14-like [Prorops nasuta]|uniref:scoloptoxin SSD14-like n=1 Tax=Prorops nasuta TaxID=863751 RepID=UPI0034CDA5A0
MANQRDTRPNIGTTENATIDSETGETTFPAGELVSMIVDVETGEQMVSPNQLQLEMQAGPFLRRNEGTDLPREGTAATTSAMEPKNLTIDSLDPATRAPAIPTIEPIAATATAEPVASITQPATAIIDPVAATIEPTAATVEPATIAVEPAIVNTESVAVLDKPSTATGEPASATGAPIAATGTVQESDKDTSEPSNSRIAEVTVKDSAVPTTSADIAATEKSSEEIKVPVETNVVIKQQPGEQNSTEVPATDTVPSTTAVTPGTDTLPSTTAMTPGAETAVTTMTSVTQTPDEGDKPPSSNWVAWEYPIDENEIDTWSQKSVKSYFIFGGVGVFITVALVIVLSFYHAANCKDQWPSSKLSHYTIKVNTSTPSAATSRATKYFQNKLRILIHGAVCSDSGLCAEIGSSMFQRNGSAVDAAIATMLCNGLINMQSMGIGGGFLMTIYKKDIQETFSLNAKDRAPDAVNASTFLNRDSTGVLKGPHSIAIPGELAGYWAAHQRFGNLNWRELFQPTIKLCEKGYTLTNRQYQSILRNEYSIYHDETLKGLFVNPKTNIIKTAGSLIKPIALCKTLKKLAEEGATEFYEGQIAADLIKDLEQIGAMITLDDLKNYEIKWQQPIEATFSDGTTLKTMGLPGSGGLLALILNILDEYKFKAKDIADTTAKISTYHKMTEAFKYAFAIRTRLGDPDYVDMTGLMNNITSKDYADAIRELISLNKTFEDPSHYGDVYTLTEDHGTSHTAVLAPNGDAVSVTSTINYNFGSGIVSHSTGILLNNGVNDFDSSDRDNIQGVPANKNNFVEPFKQSISSMCPSILTDSNGNVRLVVGAAGGTKIITAVAQTIVKVNWMGQRIKDAISQPRIHHQLFPNELIFEADTPRPVIKGLQKLGHRTLRSKDNDSVVCSIYQANGTLVASADKRKGSDNF